MTPTDEATFIDLWNAGTEGRNGGQTMGLMQVFRLAPVLLETTILMASIWAGTPSLDQEASVLAGKVTMTSADEACFIALWTHGVATAVEANKSPNLADWL
jgi:hypothetical protein